MSECKREREREERRAQLWSKVNGWLAVPKKAPPRSDGALAAAKDGVNAAWPAHVEGALNGRMPTAEVEGSSALLRRRALLDAAGGATGTSTNDAPSDEVAAPSAERRALVARLMSAAAANKQVPTGASGRGSASANDFLALLPQPPQL